MAFDKAFYEFYVSAVAEFETDIKVMFGEDMEQLVKSCDSFKTRGLFSLTYKYIPLNYIITIENEFREFNIVIEDEEGASTSLSRIKDYDSNLRNSNIKNAIIMLKTTLKENNFNFYFTKDNKLYRKNKEGIKRIKDIRKEFFSNDWQENFWKIFTV